MFILTTFLNLTIQREGGILHTEAVLGDVQIHTSAVVWSHFGKFNIFFEFPFFGVITPSKSILDKFPLFGYICEVGYDDAHPK